LPLEATLQNVWLYNFYNFQLKLTLKLKKPHVAGACVAYRKTAFQKVGGFDESRATLEDIALSEKIAKLGKIIVNTNTAALHSTRRIKKWGVLRSLGKYSKLYLEYLLQGKNFDYREYPPIR
jgi:GT2 family glycosyltransferase